MGNRHTLLSSGLAQGEADQQHAHRQIITIALGARVRGSCVRGQITGIVVAPLAAALRCQRVGVIARCIARQCSCSHCRWSTIYAGRSHANRRAPIVVGSRTGDGCCASHSAGGGGCDAAAACLARGTSGCGNCCCVGCIGVHACDGLHGCVAVVVAIAGLVLAQ